VGRVGIEPYAPTTRHAQQTTPTEQPRQFAGKTNAQHEARANLVEFFETE